MSTGSGLVTSKKMFECAYQGGFAIGAFNVNNMEVLQGIVEAAEEQQAPVIIQASSGAIKYAGIEYLRRMVEVAAQQSGLPICLHLDHGNSFELCKHCIDHGFTSVMFDGSHLPFEQNAELTKEVVDYAHAHGAAVEAELGRLAGVEDDVKVSAEQALYTDPQEAIKFVQLTGVDSLAIAIGTSHGAYKFSGTPHLRLDILHEIAQAMPGLPVVLHGASSVPEECIDRINRYGGQMPGARGVPGELLREAARSAVCKVNVDSDLRLAMTGTIRQFFHESPKEFDPRGYLGAARKAIRELVSYKMAHVLGCSGSAKLCQADDGV